MFNIKKTISITIFAFSLLLGQVHGWWFYSSKSNPNNGTRYISINNDTDKYYMLEFDLWTEGNVLGSTNFCMAAAPKFRVILQPKETTIVDTEVIAMLKDYKTEFDQLNYERGWGEYISSWFYLSEWGKTFDSGSDKSKDNSFYKTGWIKSKYKIWAVANSEPLVELLETIKACLPQKKGQPVLSDTIGKEFLSFDNKSNVVSKENREKLMKVFKKYLSERPSTIVRGFLDPESYDLETVSNKQLIGDLEKAIDSIKLEFTYVEQDKLTSSVCTTKHMFSSGVYNEYNKFYKEADKEKPIFEKPFMKSDIGRDIKLGNNNILRYVWSDGLRGWDFMISSKTEMQRDEAAQEKVNNLFNFKPKEKPKVKYKFSGWDDDPTL